MRQDDYGCLYSFELKEAQPPNEFSVWRGCMGTDKDFVVEELSVDTESKKIEGRGKNSRDEVLEVSGRLNEKVSKWQV